MKPAILIALAALLASPASADHGQQHGDRQAREKRLQQLCESIGEEPIPENLDAKGQVKPLCRPVRQPAPPDANTG